MGCQTPSQAMNFSHGGREILFRNQSQSVVGSAFAVRFTIRLTHPCPFKATIDADFDTADPQPVVAFARTDPPAADNGFGLFSFVPTQADEMVDPHGQQAA